MTAALLSALLPSGAPLALVIVFWLAVGAIAYPYVGYPLVALALARLRPRPHQMGDALPRVSLVIAAYNEADVIAAKLADCALLDYPADLLEVIVVADGSTDATADVARGCAGVRVLYSPERRGKAAAVNRAVAEATGAVIVLSDANSAFAPGSLRALVRHFADPAVAMVAGEKRVANDARTIAEGDGLYWRYESWLKRLDSASGSVMGAAGEIIAVRRERWEPVDTDAVIEDFVMSLRLVEAGWRVLYEPAATSTEQASPSADAEWVRRVRICAGGWQAMVRLRGLMHPRHGLAAFQYVSHRVLRWALTPFALPVALGASVLLASHPLYAAAAGLQLACCALAAAGALGERAGWRPRALYVPFYFAFLNACAVAGLVRHLRGRQAETWPRAARAGGLPAPDARTA